jgi:ADP-ribose pyrophosphatase YjhB (NUDIX family)
MNASEPVKRAAMILVTYPVRPAYPMRELYLSVVDANKFLDLLLPGGHVEEGESIEEAAQRELKEETDLHVYLEDLVPLASGLGIAEPDCEVTIFLARTVFGREKPVEHGTSLAWSDWKELMRRSSFKMFFERHFPKGFSHLKSTTWK